MQPFEGDEEGPRRARQLRVPQCEESADVDEVVLLRRDGRTIRIGTDLEKDLLDGVTVVPGLSLLDEPGVLQRPRGIEHQEDVVLLAERVGRTKVLEGHGLAAGEIDVGLDRDVWDPLRAVFVDEVLELLEVDIALERVQARGVVCLVDDHVDEGPARPLLVEPRRGEVHVAGDDVARIDEDLAEDVLGAATLVRGHQLGIPVHLSHRVLEAVKGAAPRVRLVPHHEGGPLQVGHCRCARIGEQIDVDVLGTEQERVPTCLGNRRIATFSRGHGDCFHHLDAERLRPAARTGVIRFFH